ncbi:hypothetical protein GRI43_09560 [Altererythrobacter luteolus]|uniref:Uncharacterized protein n=1 Tax=Pontixanthobacter luteolus TaxID=295089 RepID=A0A6I4V1N6_9SPHN|nr:DUF6768 family protein [Pontixanthobacter luteolus]MXP47625.1 hypothetical protein [Pontixanthobacter luteolus]
MTDKLEMMIDEALNAEERDLLRSVGAEPGYLKQVWGVFGGEIGWVSWLLMLFQILMFAASVYAAIRFFNAADTLEALRWGLPSATLLILAAQTKMLMWPTLQANRVIREVKRLELQLARREN